LADPKLNSYVIGCSNQVFAHQKKIKAEVFVNVTDGTIELLDRSDYFNYALSLTTADHIFMSQIIQKVEETWTPDGCS